MLSRLFGFGQDQNADPNQVSQPSFIDQNPGLKDMGTLFGLGLLMKGQNRNADLTPLFSKIPEMAEARKKQDQLNQMATDFSQSPVLKDPQTAKMVSDLVAAGMPDKAFEIIKNATPKAAEPYTLSPGSQRYGADNKLLAETPAAKSELQKNLEAAGYKEGTPEFNQIVKDYYSKIGGRGGVKGQLWDQFIDQVGKDNPGVPATTLRQIVDAHINGDQTLPDGSPVPAISPLAQQRLAAARMGSTTAALVTKGVQANQADAEMNVLKNFAQAGSNLVGTTYAGYSPAQIAASLSTDSKAAQDLGKIAASQQLQYEIAQNEIKLANGEPGVTTTQELMNLGMQGINAKYPKMSAKARQAAQDYFTTALKYGLKIRNRIGITSNSAIGQTGLTAKQTKLMNDADEAIKAGADASKVYEQLDKMLGQ